jgi:hypothetical protein
MQKELEVSRTLHFDDLKSLANVAAPCISVYVPLESAPNTTRREHIRLKSAVRRAEELAGQWKLAPADFRALVEPLNTITGDSENWRFQPESTLVILRSPDVFRAFEVRQHFDDSVCIGHHFHLFPLIPALQRQKAECPPATVHRPYIGGGPSAAGYPRQPGGLAEHAAPEKSRKSGSRAAGGG